MKNIALFAFFIYSLSHQMENENLIDYITGEMSFKKCKNNDFIVLFFSVCWSVIRNKYKSGSEWNHQSSKLRVYVQLN